MTDSGGVGIEVGKQASCSEWSRVFAGTQDISISRGYSCRGAFPVSGFICSPGMGDVAGVKRRRKDSRSSIREERRCAYAQRRVTSDSVFIKDKAPLG